MCQLTQWASQSPHFADGAIEIQQEMGLDGGHIARKQQSRDSSLESARTGRVDLREGEA